MVNKKRPVVFITKRYLKPIEERKGLKGDDLYNVETKSGIFHQWGSEVEEGENEVASLTVGIIEDEDGQIHTPIAQWVKFTDK